MQAFLQFMGHGFCHQLASRSFEAGGLIFSVCARDTGIYLGFFFVMLVTFVLYARVREKPAELPPVWYLIVLVFFLVPMAFDGITSYLGLRSTTNVIRYLTGFPTGMALGTLVVPLLFALCKDSDPKKRILSKPSHIAIQLGATLVLGVAFLLGYPFLGVISPFLVVVAFLAILLSVNLVIITLSKRMAPRHTLKHWCLLLAICLVMAFAEITLFGLLREAALNLLAGGQDLLQLLP